MKKKQRKVLQIGILGSLIGGIILEIVHIIGKLIYYEETRNRIIELISLVLKLSFG